MLHASSVERGAVGFRDGWDGSKHLNVSCKHQRGLWLSRYLGGRFSQLGFPFPDVQGSGGIFNAESGVIEFDTEETISFFNNIFGVDVSCDRESAYTNC